MEINLRNRNKPSCPTSGEFHIWKAFSFRKKEQLINRESTDHGGISLINDNTVFTPSRRIVAEIAASYLGALSKDIQFDDNEEGKPFIKGVDGLYFNLSHCGNDLAVVFASEEVGFDMEQKGRKADFGRLAKRFFTAEEAIEVEKNGGELFLHRWTAKEAMLKLIGRGLQGGLANAVVVSSNRGKVCGEIVSLLGLDWPEYHAHIATRGQVKVVREFEFTENFREDR